MSEYIVETMNQYDMALELAEREILAISLQEALDISRKEIIAKWLKTAHNAPQSIALVYKEAFQ